MINSSTRVSIIVALGREDGKYRAIGNNDRLLWHIPEDLKHFKSITYGHPIIMGRKTHESIGRALPGRTNIVVTRDTDYKSEGCVIKHSLEEAIEFAKSIDAEEIFITGGGQIYKQSLPYTERLYLTLIDKEEAADSFFPDYDEFSNELSSESGKWNGIKYTWVTLERAL